MGKLKLYELAKDMDMSSKELLEYANTIGISIKSHLSVISDEDAEKIKENFKKVEKVQEKIADKKSKKENTFKKDTAA